MTLRTLWENLTALVLLLLIFILILKVRNDSIAAYKRDLQETADREESEWGLPLGPGQDVPIPDGWW